MSGIDWANLVLEPQGSLTAFDGRLVLDLDTQVATADGHEAQLTRADSRLLRGLIELGEGVHDPDVILWKVFRAILDPRELKFPMTVLNMKLGEPRWIERTEAGWSLRPPGSPGPTGS
ncbi:hypothetical protein ABZW30_25355 [Kitasatospora sp. NPDC004669]|uniref:hypothetical protein n=1 Tax=Kitasatospora sp. NPDC004669 TaxID=3154555 RepID=UPI0033A3D8C7